MYNKINITGFLLTGLLTFTGCQNKNTSYEGKPNFLIIMTDDMGYSDPGCYGGEIKTPNIDYLAENGLRFTEFYNCARCCPTRASLLTGVYQHEAGLARNGRSLTHNVVTLAEVLKQGGYQTGMTGKWHLSRTKPLEDKEEQLKWLSHRADYGNFAPLESYPCNRGFDEHYGMIWGVVNYFDPFSLVHNEEPIKQVPEDFYITNFITNKSIDLIDQFNKKENPFFLYVAYTAPHWPLHALEEDIKKYEGMYDDGWDSLRVKRYRRMLEMDIFDPETTPLAPNESGLSWEECEYKDWEADHMETHAAMVDRVDQGIGKIIKKLKESNQMDNTLILFLSDNGASPERGFPPGFDRPGHIRNGEEINYIEHQDTIHPGPQKTWAYLGKAWAGAINSPFRYWKKESYEGGYCTPFIIHWPKGLKTVPGSLTNQVGHVMDIMPTFLELAGIEYPKEYKGHEITPYAGKSLAPIIKGNVREPHDILFWEHAGGKAVRIGDWKMAALKDEKWELFNLKNDRTEMNDLSEEFPAKVTEMEMKWKNWYEQVNR